MCSADADVVAVDEFDAEEEDDDATAADADFTLFVAFDMCTVIRVSKNKKLKFLCVSFCLVNIAFFYTFASVIALFCNKEVA